MLLRVLVIALLFELIIGYSIRRQDGDDNNGDGDDNGNGSGDTDNGDNGNGNNDNGNCANYVLINVGLSDDGQG